jgi:metallo-beta-lactamase class B
VHKNSLIATVCVTGALTLAVNSGVAATPDSWTRAQEPFRVFGNTYYIGTRGLASLLIASDKGHVVIDGTLPENASQLAANIRALGFRVEDVKIIVNSHAHSDHAGAIAELQRMSRAKVFASPEGAASMRRGGGAPNDPQFEYGDAFPPIANVITTEDGATLAVGATRIQVHFTPGHTPGGTSWTWQACEDARCLNLVYADSLTAVSDDSFRYGGDARYPSALADFRRSIARVSALPCDILITPHPEASGLWDRVERKSLADKDACKRYAAAATTRLDERIASEAKQ